MGDLDVLHEHDHLLGRDEALEAGPWLIGLQRLNLGGDAFPDDTSCNGEQVLHQVGLTRELQVYGTVSQARRAAGKLVLSMLLNSTHGILESHKLDVGVHGLAGDLFHDDVNGLLGVIQDL